MFFNLLKTALFQHFHKKKVIACDNYFFRFYRLRYVFVLPVTLQNVIGNTTFYDICANSNIHKLLTKW
jgi:hypothetical protein